MTSVPRSWDYGTALVVVLALALRVYAVECAVPSDMWDAQDYRDLAQSLVHRHEYARIGNSGWDDGLVHRAYRPPGYPFFRAGLMVAFGEGPTPALYFNVVSEIVALCFVIAAARSASDRRGGLIAAVLFAPVILFVTNQLTESVSLAFAAVLTWGLVDRSVWRSRAHAILMGSILGLAILTRPISVFWAPALAIDWWRSADKSARRLAEALGPLLALIGAWTLRNYLLFGTFVWSSTNLGVHNAAELHIPWARLTELRRSGLDEPRADRALVREVVAVAVSQPYETFLLLKQRLTDLFSVSESNCVELEYSRTHVYAESPRMLDILHYSVLWLRMTHAVGVVGAFTAALRPAREAERRLLLPFVVFVVLQCLISRGDVRLIAPLLPILTVLGAGLVNRG